MDLESTARPNCGSTSEASHILRANLEVKLFSEKIHVQYSLDLEQYRRPPSFKHGEDVPLSTDVLSFEVQEKICACCNPKAARTLQTLQTPTPSLRNERNLRDLRSEVLRIFAELEILELNNLSLGGNVRGRCLRPWSSSVLTGRWPVVCQFWVANLVNVHFLQFFKALAEKDHIAGIFPERCEVWFHCSEVITVSWKRGGWFIHMCFISLSDVRLSQIVSCKQEQNACQLMQNKHAKKRQVFLHLQTFTTLKSLPWNGCKQFENGFALREDRPHQEDH